MPQALEDFEAVPDRFLFREWTDSNINCITSKIWWGRPDVEAASWLKLPKNKEGIKLLKKRPKLKRGEGPQLMAEVRVVGRSDAPLSQTLGFALKKARELTNGKVMFAKFKGRFRGETSVFSLGTVGTASFAVAGGDMPDKRILQAGGGTGIGRSKGELADVIIIEVEVYNVKK
jgi:hypothetical protein